MRILLLSAYDATSHRQWRRGLVTHLNEHEWTVLTLPDRHFSWRIRGNALSWATEQKDLLQQPFDLIVATSMVDLATLRGLVYQLAATPTLLYFHENQFAYPESGHAHSSVEAQITSIYSAMAADRLLFNSEYNRKTFLLGATGLLKKMPDHAPLSALEILEHKSAVLAVPVDDICVEHRQTRGDLPVTLVWNHRWEYDKGPERLYLVLKELSRCRLDFQIHILGQQFRKRPDAFAMINNEFGEQILSWGYIEDRNAYLQILQQSDIVFSTALHDFQGLAMLEAIAAGCVPVAPNRLAYPEYISTNLLSDSYECEAEHDAIAIAAMIMRVADNIDEYRTDIPDIAGKSWAGMVESYRRELGRLTTP
ncbi:glycosyl transferases group 1 [Mariprofundus micogutta]|uniref:tRNA-queuosine alpha-mannosyltransferase n=1 Tax=Mariprofundus micogutta TaxID=1921010 RepID=A0A1L8CNJ4_9PROT|nr:DUF3524 domain-containing protein [Mariprofundus micogutta]GAV20486.1 glycosyl transferases group 1 [Mariprofundus micogutta]